MLKKINSPTKAYENLINCLTAHNILENGNTRIKIDELARKLIDNFSLLLKKFPLKRGSDILYLDCCFTIMNHWEKDNFYRNIFSIFFDKNNNDQVIISLVLTSLYLKKKNQFSELIFNLIEKFLENPEPFHQRAKKNFYSTLNYIIEKNMEDKSIVQYLVVKSIERSLKNSEFSKGTVSLVFNILIFIIEKDGKKTSEKVQAPIIELNKKFLENPKLFYKKNAERICYGLICIITKGLKKRERAQYLMIRLGEKFLENPKLFDENTAVNICYGLGFIIEKKLNKSDEAQDLMVRLGEKFLENLELFNKKPLVNISRGLCLIIEEGFKKEKVEEAQDLIIKLNKKFLENHKLFDQRVIVIFSYGLICIKKKKSEKSEKAQELLIKVLEKYTNEEEDLYFFGCRNICEMLFQIVTLCPEIQSLAASIFYNVVYEYAKDKNFLDLSMFSNIEVIFLIIFKKDIKLEIPAFRAVQIFQARVQEEMGGIYEESLNKISNKIKEKIFGITWT